MKKYLPLIIVLIVVLLGACGVYYYYSQKQIDNTNLPIPPGPAPISTAPTPVMTPEDSLVDLTKALEFRVGISHPAISSSVLISKDKLPADMIFFLPTDSTTIKAEELHYPNGSVGHRASFTRNELVPQTYVYFRLLGQAKYDFVAGERNDSALLVVSRGGYLYYIAAMANASNGSDVVITTFKK